VLLIGFMLAGMRFEFRVLIIFCLLVVLSGLILLLVVRLNCLCLVWSVDVDP
jgi:hypothetical protein